MADRTFWDAASNGYLGSYLAENAPGMALNSLAAAQSLVDPVRRNQLAADVGTGFLRDAAKTGQWFQDMAAGGGLRTDPATGAQYEYTPAENAERSFALAGAFGAGGIGMTRPVNSLGMAGRPRRYQHDYYGQPVTIMENPSKQSLERFLAGTKYKAARRIRDPATGDVWVWDAADPALHRQMADSLGLKNIVADTIGLD